MITSVTMKSVNHSNAVGPGRVSVQDLPWAGISGALVAAEDALARLDERLRVSPVREGWIARSHFRDVVASAWVSGELVSLEDLVLHDAGMDARAPSAALTRAREILRVRRRIARGAGASALTTEGLDVLRGRAAAQPSPGANAVVSSAAGQDDSLALLLAEVDAAVDRSRKALEQVEPEQSARRDPLVYDLDWNEEERLGQWRAALGETTALPPVLAAALAARAWEAIQPLQHQPWLGRLLVAVLLRERGKMRTHLPCLFVGLRAAGRAPKRPTTLLEALLVGINALTATARDGLREHDRLVLARLQFQNRLKARRSTSRLPDLVDLVLATPLISTGLVARRLAISQRAAQDLIAELDLREFTGRERYRAWGVV